MVESILRLPLMDDSPTARLLYGVDVREGLKLLPDASVHCVATSPPYWGLRDYEAEGQLGREDSPDEYVQNLVDVFREVKRVLRSDGSVWLNLGDTFSAEHLPKSNLKPKDLAGIPWRVAFALQADGWYLRAACPWVKRNVMPTSVQDRPTTAVEMVFLLGHPEGGGRYYYDIDAIRVGHAPKSMKRYESGLHMRTDGHAGESSLRARASAGMGQSDRMGDFINMAGRNRRDSDWFFESLHAVIAAEERLIAGEEGDPLAFVVNPKSYKGAHFACWPPEIVEPMIWDECGGLLPILRSPVEASGGAHGDGVQVLRPAGREAGDGCGEHGHGSPRHDDQGP